MIGNANIGWWNITKCLYLTILIQILETIATLYNLTEYKIAALKILLFFLFYKQRPPIYKIG